MNRRILGTAVCVAAIGIAGWYFFKPANQEKSGKTETAATSSPAISVSLTQARQMNVPVRLQANGYVSSLNSVDIRPQISNIITKVHIREGQFVKTGDLLFSLDDRADRVNLQKVQAQMAKNLASLADLERQLMRNKELVSKSFIAQSALDTIQAQVDAQRAAVQVDKAAIEAARVSLDYDTIRASSSGRAGAIQVFPGSLVQPTSAPLVTISQLDPIAVTFTLPEGELNALLTAQKAGGVKVNALVQNATKPIEGTLRFIDNNVDSQSGTVKVKAIFPNASQLLWPGQYIAVDTIVRELKDAIVIPQAAIITGIDSRSVYIVGQDKTAQARRIEPVYTFGAQAAVKGIKAGENIVVDGKQNLRSGSKIKEAPTSQDREIAKSTL